MKLKVISPAVVGVFCTVFGWAAYAQTSGNDERESVLENVVVIGSAPTSARGDLIGSKDLISREELAYEHVDDTLELFNKLPGVYISRYNQGIINNDVSIRGFAGDGVTPHAKLLIDGIPANLHNGYNELDQLFPLAIGSIQTFKGTSDPRYGLFNIAGNYNVATRADEGRVLETTLGSYDTREIQAYLGSVNGRLNHSYSLGYREAEGYRDHTNLEKSAVSGRWFYQLNDSSELGFNLRYAGYEGDAPGYLSETEAQNDPTASADYANQDGGDKTTAHYSLHYNTSLSDAVDMQIKMYQQQFERERWVRFSAGGSIQNRFDDQDQFGFIADVQWQLGDGWSLNWGADLQQEDVIEQRFGTVGQTRQRDTANVIRNRHYEFDSVGTYVQLHNVSDRLTWNIGYRLDELDGSYRSFDALGNASDGDIYDFGWIAQPKANIAFQATETVNVFLNYGRGFQHPFGASAYTAGDTSARDVSYNDGWESGVFLQWDNVLQIRLSFWQQDASDEFVVVDGTAQNVGETERNGVDFALNWYASEQWYVWFNYTTVNAEITRPDDAQTAFVGNEPRSIPDYTTSLGVNYQINDKLSARLHLDGQGDYYVNEANLGNQFGDYALLSMNLDYDTNWGSVSFQFNNLLDEFAEYVYDFSADGTATIHSPMDGRNASISVSWDFQ